MLDRGFCVDDMTVPLNTVQHQMGTYHNNYSNNGHYNQNMYSPQGHRPSSFAIQELLGLANPAYRQNNSPDLIDSQSGNFMYLPREFSMYNNGPQDPVNQNYINPRDQQPHHPQSASPSPFCPWRFDTFTQTTVTNNQPFVQAVTSVVPRHVNNISYSCKASPGLDHEGKQYHLSFFF